jgi:Protein of unknown function (DUF2795)
MAASTTRDALFAALKGVDFVADKDTLVAAAMSRGADDDTVRALRAAPPALYGGMSEVLRAVRLREEEDDVPPPARAVPRREHTKPWLWKRSKGIPLGR